MIESLENISFLPTQTHIWLKYTEVKVTDGLALLFS